MALINYTSKEVTLKIVYYGPGLSGKTTNLQHLHSNIAQERRGKLISLATETDRTLFFDFMPMTLGKIGDFTVKFQLYTVPGQVRYNATRKLVLKGGDAVVFVADSQSALREQNIESFTNMLDNLKANNLDPEDITIVLQYNKRDLDEVMPVEVMDRDLNAAGHKTVLAEAVNGKGVDETFKLVTNLLLRHFAIKHRIGLTPAPPAKAPLPPPPPRQQPPKERYVIERLGAPDTTVASAKPIPVQTPRQAVEEPRPAIKEAPPVEEKEAVESLSPLEIPRSGLPPLGTFAEPATEEAEQESLPAEATLPEALFPEAAAPATDVEGAMKDALISLSELVAELKASRKNQEEMIRLLKKIEGAIVENAQGRAAKRA